MHGRLSKYLQYELNAFYIFQMPCLSEYEHLASTTRKSGKSAFNLKTKVDCGITVIFQERAERTAKQVKRKTYTLFIFLEKEPQNDSHLMLVKSTQQINQQSIIIRTH